jgi:Flp pilus assembly protein TadG
MRTSQQRHSGRQHRRRSQRGQASLEMIGILPLFVIILGAVIQLFMIGYSAVSAEASARVAARELSKGSSASTATQLAEQDAPRVFEARVVTSDGNLSRAGQEPSVGAGAEAGSVSASATLTVPFLGIGVRGLDMHVTRYAVFPRTS